MSAEENKATIRRLIAAHNRRDADGAAACFAPGATNHGRAAGPEGMAAVYRDLYVTFPDFHWELQVLFAADDWVAAKVLHTGTHLGQPSLPVFGGLIHDKAPTGKKVAVHNIHLYRMESGLVAEHSAVRDDLGMMQQLGLLPATRHESGDMSRAT
jgi:predicted ester cyclase